jgi:Fe2+ transport system protein FeoA
MGRLAVLGFLPGEELTMVQNYGHGPVIVTVRDTRVALGRGEADQITVRRA